MDASPSKRAPRSPSTPPIRMVAIDLDGTLLNDGKAVSDQTIDALRCLLDQDVKIIIASARPPRGVRPVYRQLMLDTWQINYNGALIWDEPERKVVFHRPMDGALVREIAHAARDAFDEVILACEILDRWYTDRDDMTHTTQTGRMFKPNVIAPLESFCDRQITKLMLLGPPNMILRLEKCIGDQYSHLCGIVRGDDDLIQIMDRRVSKGLALQRAAEHYDIPMEQVMAIGDAPNDVGMLKAAGVAVAMDNAYPVVKEIADWIAPSNNDHGVHAALRRYGLCL